MKNIIILTGNELRHRYFKTILVNDKRLNVIKIFAEGDEKGLAARLKANIDSTFLEREHLKSREQIEKDMFSDMVSKFENNTNTKYIKKGSINDQDIVNEIINLKPDLLVCYGSSLIKSKLLNYFDGRFLNVHLGLSPYYRGSATNIWPMINNELNMVGVTFMHIDSGIDTGRIIHQIQADIFLGDNPHTIGNRLIKKMTNTYIDIILKFESLSEEVQPDQKGKLFFIKDLKSHHYERLYENFRNKIVDNFLKGIEIKKTPYLVSNKIFKR